MIGRWSLGYDGQMWDCESAFASTVLFLLKSCQVQRLFKTLEGPQLRRDSIAYLSVVDWMMAVLHFPLNTGPTDVQC